MGFNSNKLNEGLNEGAYVQGRPTVSVKVEKLFKDAMWYYISKDGKTVAIETKRNEFDIYVGDELTKKISTTKQKLVAEIEDYDDDEYGRY